MRLGRREELALCPLQVAVATTKDQSPHLGDPESAATGRSHVRPLLVQIPCARLPAISVLFHCSRIQHTSAVLFINDSCVFASRNIPLVPVPLLA